MLFKFLFVVCTFILFVNTSNGQLADHLFVENDEMHVLRDQNIHMCNSFVTNYDTEVAARYLSTTDEYNKLGQQIRSTAYSIEGGIIYEIKFTYDSQHRVHYMIWDWFENNTPGIEVDSSCYEYDEKNRVTKEISYAKVDSSFVFREVQHFYYANDSLALITDSNNDTLDYYKNKANHATRFNKKHEVTSGYTNGLQDYLHHGYSHFTYIRNDDGKIVRTENKNLKNNTTIHSDILWENGLPVQSVNYGITGKVESVFDHEYIEF